MTIYKQTIQTEISYK